MPPIRVLIVDDDALARHGIAEVVGHTPDMTVVGEVADGEHVVGAVQAHHPDVVLMDIQLGQMDGIEALRAVRRLPGAPHVLMLTSFNREDFVIDAIDAGADGYVLKVQAMDELAGAIRAAIEGDAFLSPASTRRLLTHVAGAQGQVQREAAAAIARLSDKERAVLIELASGDTNAVIGARMFLAEGTVKAHVAALSRKLGCNRTQAVLLAERAGLLR